MVSRDTFMALLALLLFTFICGGLLFQEPVLAYNFHNLLPYREVVRQFPSDFYLE